MVQIAVQEFTPKDRSRASTGIGRFLTTGDGAAGSMFFALIAPDVPRMPVAKWDEGRMKDEG